MCVVDKGMRAFRPAWLLVVGRSRVTLVARSVFLDGL